MLLGEPGAVLNGAKEISSWTHSGDRWIHEGGTSNPGSLIGECENGTNACAYPDDVFFDDVRLERVLSMSNLGDGQVYVDYAADEIYLAQDPAGHDVEYALAAKAVDGNGATSVTVEGLIVEKFATPAQTGAIATGSGANWVVQNNEVRLNHGGGIDASSPSAIVRGNHVHDQGQLGLHGYQVDGVLVDGNEIDHNNTAGYDDGWEAGGSKWVKTSNLVLTGNNAHDNYGTGLWIDIENVNVTVENNTVTNNAKHGIFYEISYAGIIRDNVVYGNDRDAIKIGDSSSVEVAGNIVTVVASDTSGYGIRLYQDDRQSDGYITTDVTVHDNTVTMCAGRTGAEQYVGQDDIFDSRNNHFEDNTYFVSSLDDDFWIWKDANRTEAQWTGYSNDETGTFAEATC